MKSSLAKLLLATAAMLSICSLELTNCHAQGTAFTYQGRLSDSSALANGSYDLTFTLFGVESGGSAVSGPVIKLASIITDGVFTVSLDFGPGQFTGAARWLEIAARPSGAGSFTTLSPRQPVMPTPYAMYAASAGVGGGSPWLLNGTAAYYNGGNVGIGTSSPQAPLQITSPGFAVVFLHDTNANATQTGYVSYRNASFTETAWVGYGTPGSPDFSIVNARSGGNIVLLPFSGNVGVGTSAPTAKLEVHGDIRLGSSGQFRATSGEESLRIVRGAINPDGSVLTGSGFTVETDGPGIYIIRFPTPFSAMPVVTASARYFVSGEDTAFTQVENYPAYVVVDVWRRSDGSHLSRGFDFIAIGPR